MSISISFGQLILFFNLLLTYCLLMEHSGKLYFIDFEYGSYSYRGFDIGNHFNEYAGYDCDYSLYVIFLFYMLFPSFLSRQWLKWNELFVVEHVFCRYPTKDEQYHFFRHYLAPDKPNEVCKNDIHFSCSFLLWWDFKFVIKNFTCMAFAWNEQDISA